MSDIKIIDNFLSSHDYSTLKQIMLSLEFQWHYSDKIVEDIDLSCDQKNNYQFVHKFYGNHRPADGIENIKILDIFFKKIQPLFVFRVKANLLTRTDSRVYHGFHTDYNNPNLPVKTALYYVNTNNGVTAFEDGTEIHSAANRLAIFDANIKHTGTTCTDQKMRCVINFVYIPSEK